MNERVCDVGNLDCCRPELVGRVVPYQHVLCAHRPSCALPAPNTTPGSGLTHNSAKIGPSPAGPSAPNAAPTMRCILAPDRKGQRPWRCVVEEVAVERDALESSLTFDRTRAHQRGYRVNLCVLLQILLIRLVKSTIPRGNRMFADKRLGKRVQ